MMNLEPPKGFESQDRMIQGKRVFITFPPFHVCTIHLKTCAATAKVILKLTVHQGAYLVSHLFNAISFGTVMIAPISGAISTAKGLVEGLKKTPADIAFIVPSIVQELSQDPELLAYCSRHLEAIIFCGGDLPQAIGDVVALKIELFNQFGASELGLTPNILSIEHREPQDWKYVQFHPDLGIEMRHVTDGVHELYAKRDSAIAKQQPTFTIFPQAQEYASRDLFVRHPDPEKRDLWCWRARADDIIVFLNGEKTNPISMEQHITSRNPDITAALVIGAQRFQAALLLETASDGMELLPIQRAALIENFWPSIEEANQEAPSHARIAKTHILFTDPDKPMLRAGKGTVQRAGTLLQYADKINALYADADMLSSPIRKNGEAVGLDTFDISSMTRFVRAEILAMTKWEDMDSSQNFFTRGMDSLQAITLTRNIRQRLGFTDLALSTLYTNPSLMAFASALLRLPNEQQVSRDSKERQRLQTRMSILKEYEGMIDRMVMRSSAAEAVWGELIILTGSTGALGCHILHSLLENPHVKHVYCLNRASDGCSLQAERNKTYGLPAQVDSSRVTFLRADVSQHQLGLPPDIFQKLLGTVTSVIHNAWPVNFNLSLPSFRPQLDGLINLVHFSTNATSSARLFFISSISSVMSYRSTSSAIPEKVIAADVAPGPNGYAESKYVCENLLAYAAQRLSTNQMSFVRVGQIAGAVYRRSVWNKAEWFPSLIISSRHIGAIPDSLGKVFDTVDWIPIDHAAEIIVELALPRDAPDNEHGKARVYHLTNPRPVAWESVRPIVIDELARRSRNPPEVVCLNVWLQKVRKSIEDRTGNRGSMQDGELETLLRETPAVKLLDFYESMLGDEDESSSRLDLTETMKCSPRLRMLEGIKNEWIRKWVGEWSEA